jgi:hypothetical protein
MTERGSCCPSGSTICCSLPSSINCSGSGLRCRFGLIDVPATLCGDTICCTAPALVSLLPELYSLPY